MFELNSLSGVYPAELLLEKFFCHALPHLWQTARSPLSRKHCLCLATTLSRSFFPAPPSHSVNGLNNRES